MRHATIRLAIHAFQRLLGLRRPFRYKIVPIVLAAVCYLPVIAFVGMSAFAGAASPVSFRQLIALLGTPVLLFVIAVGPGGLIADRNSKSLSLYLASPLTRGTYLLAQAAALFAALCIVTLGPPLLYLAGNAVVVRIGFDDLVPVLSVAGKIVLSGTLIAAHYTALTMGVAAVSRRAATAAVALFVVAGVVSGALAAAVLNGASPYLLLVDPGSVTGELVNRLFGPEGILPEVNFYGVPMYLVALATAGWSGLALASTWYRYRRLVVSR